MQSPRHIETAWGSVVVVRHDGSVAVLHEKALGAKLELLYSKSLFLVALNLAQIEEVGLFDTSVCCMKCTRCCYSACCLKRVTH